MLRKSMMLASVAVLGLSASAAHAQNPRQFPWGPAPTTYQAPVYQAPLVTNPTTIVTGGQVERNRQFPWGPTPPTYQMPAYGGYSRGYTGPNYDPYGNGGYGSQPYGPP